VLAYPDPNGASMAVRVSTLQPDGSWTAPVTIPATGGVVDTAVIARPSGGLLLVWSQIATADYGNPLCGSTVHFVTAPDGQTWGAPIQMASFPGVVDGLDLARSGAQLALFLREARNGPSSSLRDVRISTWNDGGGTFSAPQTLLAEENLRAFAVGGDPAAAAPHFLLVDIQGDFTLESRVWDGTSLGAPEPVGTASGSALALAPDAAGRFVLAWMAPEAIRQRRYTPGAGWSDLPGLTTAPLAVDGLAAGLLSGPSGTGHVFVWATAGNTSDLWAQYVDDNGAPLRPAENLTQNEIGDYARPVVLPGANGTARLLAEFTASPVKIREFLLSLAVDPALADRDADGFPDTGEFALIDFDPGDAVTTLAHVTPGGDFDGDGHSNAEELRLRTDPANPASALRLLPGAGPQGLSFDGNPGVDYEVQMNPDPATPAGWTSVLGLPGRGRREVFTPQPPADNPALFRVVVPAP
jgi:hypothetical protein